MDNEPEYIILLLGTLLGTGRPQSHPQSHYFDQSDRAAYSNPSVSLQTFRKSQSAQIS